MLDEPRVARFIAQQWPGPRYRKLFNYATNGWRNQLRVSFTSFVPAVNRLYSARSARDSKSFPSFPLPRSLGIVSQKRAEVLAVFASREKIKRAPSRREQLQAEQHPFPPAFPH